MEQSLPWGADSSQTTETIRLLLWNQKVRYHVHKKSSLSSLCAHKKVCRLNNSLYSISNQQGPEKDPLNPVLWCFS
jgi:hypothetical protein